MLMKSVGLNASQIILYRLSRSFFELIDLILRLTIYICYVLTGQNVLLATINTLYVIIKMRLVFTCTYLHGEGLR